MTTRRRRRAAATATVGAGATFGGGVLRHKGIRAAHNGEAPAFSWKHPVATHQTRALLRTGARGRGRYALGATLGLVGAPALAVGGHDYVVRKADGRKQRSFLSEGIEGTHDAFSQRAAGMKETPPAAKAGPYAVGAGSAALGSLGAHRLLDKSKAFRGGRKHAMRAGITALAGTAAGAASYPLARHTVRGEYEVTPAGVRRKKKPIVRPSSKGKVFDQKRMSRGDFRRATVGKVHNPHSLEPTTSRGTPRKVHWKAHEADRAICGTDGAFGRGVGPFAENMGELSCRACRRMLHVAKADYPGRHVGFHEQRAKTMAAGAIPGIPFAGPAAAAHVAGHYAPPGEKRKAEGRQLASSAATTATGVAGAYAAAGNKRTGEQALRLHRGMQRVGERVTRPVKSRVSLKAPGGHQVASMKAKGSKQAQRALARSGTLRRALAPLRANKPAAVAGYIAGAKLTGTAYQSLAISRNQKAQERYNLKHPVVKAADPSGLSRREQKRLIERKRHAAATTAVTGALGLAGAGMGSALLPGVRGRLHPKHVQTLERAAVGTGLAAGGISGVHSIRSARLQRHELNAQERALSKADKQPLTRMHSDQAAQLVRRHGDAGPLPSNLSRSERMQAYEARYVHAGGHKAEHWQRRADIADKVKTGGLAGATAAGAGMLALRHPRVTAALGRRAHRAKEAVDSAAIGAATVSGAGELYSGHARRKRSSYSNSKAGVAASALRRMRDYSS